MNGICYDFKGDNWICLKCGKIYSKSKVYDLYFDNTTTESDGLNEKTFVYGSYCVACGNKFTTYQSK